MWSKPLLCRFLQSGKIQQTPVSQGFAAFRLTLSRIPPQHSQSRRATNCTTPRYEVRRSGRAYSPKAGALPAALHPDMYFSARQHAFAHTLKRNGAFCRVRFPRSRSAAACAFRLHRRQTCTFCNLRKIKFNTFFRNSQRFSALQFRVGCGMLYK